MSLYDVFDAIEQSPIGAGIKNSTWLFPGIEAVHLLALALLGGSVLLLDLRLLGVGSGGSGERERGSAGCSGSDSGEGARETANEEHDGLVERGAAASA